MVIIVEPGTNSLKGFQFSLITPWCDLGWGTLIFFQEEHIMRTHEENMNHFQSWLFKERNRLFLGCWAHPTQHQSIGLHPEQFEYLQCLMFGLFKRSLENEVTFILKQKKVNMKKEELLMKAAISSPLEKVFVSCSNCIS